VFPVDGLSPELEVFISARQPFCRIYTVAHMLQYTGVTVYSVTVYHFSYELRAVFSFKNNPQNFHFPWRNRPQWARTASLPRLHDHTQTHHTLCNSSGWVIGQAQGPLSDKSTQHSQDKDIRPPGAIRTHNPSKWAVADTRFSPRDHWDRHRVLYIAGFLNWLYFMPLVDVQCVQFIVFVGTTELPREL